MADRTCALLDCEGKYYSRFLCRSHYREWQATGAHSEYALLRSQVHDPCSEDDCDEPVHGHGLCRMHWGRWKRTGSTADPAEKCRKGHLLTPENTQVSANGKRRCKTCLADWKEQHDTGDCTICGKPVRARGWCRVHYRNWEAFGDPHGRPDIERHRDGERWLPVPGYESLYDVSDLGRVWSVRYRRILKPTIGMYGYPEVKLCRQSKADQTTRPVHRIEAAAFYGPRKEDQVVRHLDGNPENNLLANLKYGTQKENLEDAMRHGTHRAAQVARRTTCVNLHEYLPGSFYFNKAGSKICKQCDRNATERYLARKAAEAFPA